MKLFAGIMENLRAHFKGNSFDVLEQQRELIHLGIEATAEVMDVFVYKEKIGGLRTIRLWVKIRRADGSLIYTCTHSLVENKNIPAIGQVLRIRYFPDNLSSIAIMLTDKP